MCFAFINLRKKIIESISIRICLQFEYIQRQIIAAYSSYIPNLIRTREGESLSLHRKILRETNRKMTHENM